MNRWEWGPEECEVDKWNRECEAEYEQYVLEKGEENSVSFDVFVDRKLEKLQEFWNDFDNSYMEERA